MSNESPRVDILLPMFNGGGYLAEQLQSLSRQSYREWRCLMRDDGSDDDTLAVARRFVRENADRFELVEDRLGNLGVIGCLNELASHARGDYFALCDQDDVWLPEKLARAIAALTALPAAPDVPTLTYSDMAVTDSELQVLAASFWDLQDSRRYALGLRGMPVLNAVAGCTMVGNRALMSAAFPVPACAPMHDHWIALVARYAGMHCAIEEPLVLYRQHGRNRRGATPPVALSKRIGRRLAGLGRFAVEARHGREARVAMLNELLVRHLPSTRVAECRAAAQVETASALARLAFLLRAGINPARAFTYWMA